VVSAVIHVSFVDLTPLSVIATCNFFWLICTARYVLSSLKISSGETKFEIFRKQVVLLREARMFDSLLQVMLLPITGVVFIFVRLPQRVVVFLVDCHRETFLCFSHQYYQAFLPSSLIILTLQI